MTLGFRGFRSSRTCCGTFGVLMATVWMGCAVQERPATKPSSRARQPEVPVAHSEPLPVPSPRAPSPDVPAVREAPVPVATLPPKEPEVVWGIRVARPRTDASPDSAWQLGEELSFRALKTPHEAVLTDPLEWPSADGAVLMLTLNKVRIGQWSARCILPRRRTEVSIPSQAVEWEPDTKSGLIPLSKIFGQRGELRDPATLCHLSVRVPEIRQDLIFSFRVFGRMPELRPVQPIDLPLRLGTIRREKWLNPTERRLQLSFDAPSTLTVSTLIRQTAFLVPGNDKPANNGVQFGLAQESKLGVQARVRQGETWTDWKTLPLAQEWMPRQELEVEYRVIPVEGAQRCNLEERELARFPWPASFRIVGRQSVESVYVTGKLHFHAQVVDFQRESEPSQFEVSPPSDTALDSGRLPALQLNVCQGIY